MRLMVIAALGLCFSQWHAQAGVLMRLGAAVENQNRDRPGTGAGRTFEWLLAQNAGTRGTASGAAASEPARSSAATHGVENVCQTLRSAARANALPLEFLTRLIWQESRFHAYAVSSAGAQGVAQFMPKTAAGVGLENPFNVANAINKSAEFLRGLKNQFGNLGLAAAAYNAGPKRVQEWLAGGRSLPAQTQAYVRIVTGHTVSDWTLPQSGQTGAIGADTISCPQLVKLLASKSELLALADKPAATPAPSLRTPAWGVQLLGNASQAAVLVAYHRLQVRFRTVLGNLKPLVLRSSVGRNAYWYRVRIAAKSLSDAEKLCSSLRAVGGNCLVQRNEQSAPHEEFSLIRSP